MKSLDLIISLLFWWIFRATYSYSMDFMLVYFQVSLSETECLSKRQVFPLCLMTVKFACLSHWSSSPCWWVDPRAQSLPQKAYRQEARWSPVHWNHGGDLGNIVKDSKIKVRNTNTLSELEKKSERWQTNLGRCIWESFLEEVTRLKKINREVLGYRRSAQEWGGGCSQSGSWETRTQGSLVLQDLQKAAGGWWQVAKVPLKL